MAVPAFGGILHVSAIVLFIGASLNGEVNFFKTLRLSSRSTTSPPTSCTRIDLCIDDEGMKSLRDAPRYDSPAAIRVDNGPRMECLVHLKGSSTFRHIDEKPSITIKHQEPWLLGRFSKLHLNNCISDSSLMRDFVARTIFSRLHIPTPDYGHALLFLNGRYLGIYAWVQGVNKAFLRDQFGESSGVLVEGELEDLTTMSNRELAARSKRGLAQESGAEADTPLNVFNAESFLAGELLTAHEDGAAFNCNNYWVYLPAMGNSAFLFPHTMDSAFRSRSMIGVNIRCFGLDNFLCNMGSRRQLLGRIDRIVNDADFWNNLFYEYDSYTSNLLATIAIQEPKSLFYRCAAMIALRAALARNLGLLQDAGRLSKDEVEFSTANLKWQPTHGSVKMDIAGTRITLGSLRTERATELTASLVLLPGKYRLKVDGRRLFESDKYTSKYQAFVNVAGHISRVAGSSSDFFNHPFEVPPLKQPAVFSCREIQISLQVTTTRRMLIILNDGIAVEREL